jgi:hypothetical protein
VTERLTEVDLVWYEGRIEHWIRFGTPIAERILDRRRRVVMFAPHQLLALVRWQANDYGTVLSRIDILRTVRPGEVLSTLPGVRPGGEQLLRLGGWPRVQRALDVISAVEALEIDPAEVAPEYWRHVHNRLLTGEAPRAYGPTQHRAWLMRRRISA